MEREWILRAAQQRALDDASADEGVSHESLMESAGLHAAEWILSHMRPTTAVILAGPGGNGGDALVVARYLRRSGVDVRTFHNEGSPAFLTQHMVDRWRSESGRLEAAGEGSATLRQAVAAAECVVDGLYGCGLRRPLAGTDVQLVETLNRSSAPVVSLDLPSGLQSDSGVVPGAAIRARFTLAMAAYKPCHWLHPAAEWCGDVHCVPVDYPKDVLERTQPAAWVMNSTTVQGLLPPRPASGHKGTFGHVLVVAGSQGMTGAAVLCARGALRIGSGLVTAAVPRSVAGVLQTSLPEVLVVALSERAGKLTDRSPSATLRAALERADVLAVGPGLSRDPRTLAFVRRLVGGFPGPMVIDADALYAWADDADGLAPVAGRSVLTPHPGEFATLTGSSASDVDAHRLDRLDAFSGPARPTLVLKGRPTLIRLPDGSIWVNPTGHSGLATGGSGDVLTGMIAGLLAGGSSPSDAARAGVFLHGLAADRWADGRAQRSLLPSDVLDTLPRVLKEFEP